jgi:hypothetical protein
VGVPTKTWVSSSAADARERLARRAAIMVGSSSVRERAADTTSLSPLGPLPISVFTNCSSSNVSGRSPMLFSMNSDGIQVADV